MLTTNSRRDVAPFLGVDLTDATAATPRPIDVCGLWPVGRAMAARFWTWLWSGEGIEDVLRELFGARCAMLDGPQALAALGSTLRSCERLTRAAGKTPDDASKTAGKPYGGFVRTSLTLFAALHRAGLAVSAPGFVGGVGEVYPGYSWTQLHPHLARKSTIRGRSERCAVLEACGVDLGSGPLSHDQLDAAIAALVAAAASGAAPGLSVRAVGSALRRRRTGELEEGPIAVLDVVPALRSRIVRAVAASADRATGRAVLHRSASAARREERTERDASTTWRRSDFSTAVRRVSHHEGRRTDAAPPVAPRPVLPNFCDPEEGIMVRHSWIIGALAAALWVAPAAAQTGSTSQGSEHSFSSGNGTDTTRNNTDNDQAPSTSREHEHAREQGGAPSTGNGTYAAPSGTGSSASGMGASGSGTGSSGSSSSSSSGRTSGSGWNGNNQQGGASSNYPYSR